MDANVDGWEQIIHYAKGHSVCEERIAALTQEIEALKAYITELTARVPDHRMDPMARGPSGRFKPRQG